LNTLKGLDSTISVGRPDLRCVLQMRSYQQFIWNQQSFLVTINGAHSVDKWLRGQELLAPNPSVPRWSDAVCVTLTLVTLTLVLKQKFYPWSSWFFKPILVFLGGSKNWDSTEQDAADSEFHYLSLYIEFLSLLNYPFFKEGVASGFCHILFLSFVGFISINCKVS